VLRKFFIKYILKTKISSLQKCIFPPQILNRGYGPGAWYQTSYRLATFLSEDLLNAMAQLIAIRILKM